MKTRRPWAFAVLLAGGADEAVLRFPDGVALASYQNSGYRSESLGGNRVRVTVDASPLDSRAPLAIGPPAADEVGRLSVAVAGDAVTVYEAVSRTLAWVSSNIRYELDRRQPQDAPSVLQRRSAYCTGIARFSVALLTARGILAREVPGWVAGEGPHRWIEVWYPDRGWVFSDPLRHHHFVPATYVRNDEPLAAITIESRSNRLRTAGEREQLPSPVEIRANQRPETAALEVDVGERSAEVAVVGRGAERRQWADGGGVRFVGLAAGEYVVRVAGEARTVRLLPSSENSIRVGAAIWHAPSQ